MTAIAKWKGWPIEFDGEVWRYSDTGRPVPENPHRHCGECNLPNREDEHDACLGHLPGVMNACCGHGVEAEAYVQFPDLTDVREGEALRYFLYRRCGPLVKYTQGASENDEGPL